MGKWDELTLMNSTLVSRNVGCLSPTHSHLKKVFPGAVLKVFRAEATQV